MSERTDSSARPGAPEPREAATGTGTGTGALHSTLRGAQDVEPVEGAAETDSKEKPKEDRQTVCPAESSSTETKWGVGARCQAVWSEDGRVYPATVVSLDGERCRVRFNGYGNEEDVELSALTSPDTAPQTQGQNSQDWKPGSPCRAVYSEDGLVYPAVVLWVKGQRCRVRFDDYNNEEEQDVSDLLNLGELHGPSRAAATGRKSSITSSNFDWKMRREENRGDRGGERRSAWRDNQQNSSWMVKEKPSDQSKVEKEAEEKKRGNQQREGAEKPTNHSFCLFPPFPPPPQSGSGEPVSFIPPPPPLWTFGGGESGGSSGDAAASMLMLWYMCGFHTGSYMAQQVSRSSCKD